MRKALVEHTGTVMEICDPGEEYEIYEGPDASFIWLDAPDDINIHWALEYSPSKDESIWVKREIPFHDPKLMRQVRYGDLGSQLDMLYHDLKEGTSNWIEHIDKVKAEVPKPAAGWPDSPQRPDETLDQMLERQRVEEPSVEKQPKMASQEHPCWLKYKPWLEKGNF